MMAQLIFAASLPAALGSTRALIFHKPVGLVTTHKDELGRRTVYDALRARLPQSEANHDWHACGRLDMETSGLLIMTTDGRLVRHVTDPTAGGNLLKQYVCRCHQLSESGVEQLRQGVDLGSGLGMSNPAAVSLLPRLDDEEEEGARRGRKQSRLAIGIRQGKNRQIRRMLHAVGSGVMSLERRAIGGLELGELAEGEYRWLSAEELEQCLGYPPPVGGGTLAHAAEEQTTPPPKPSPPEEAEVVGYRLLDSGDYARLEEFGGQLVVRPCPSASWRRGNPSSASWANAPLRFDADAAAWRGDPPTSAEVGSAAVASEEGASEEVGSSAEVAEGAPSDAADVWCMDSGAGFVLALQPGPSGQLGAFPEQRANWRWLSAACTSAISRGDRTADAPLRVLNLFGHTGASSIACAAGAAASSDAAAIEVVHVDGAKSAVSRARANSALSALAEVPVRWLCEDVMTYCRRAAKRGERFHGVIVDPPAFGRGGKKGTEWRIQRDMPTLLAVLAELLDDAPEFVLLTCHDHRWPSTRLHDAVAEMLPAGATSGQPTVEHGQMVLKATERGGRDLPMGAFARWRRR